MRSTTATGRRSGGASCRTGSSSPSARRSCRATRRSARRRWKPGRSVARSPAPARRCSRWPRRVNPPPRSRRRWLRPAARPVCRRTAWSRKPTPAAYTERGAVPYGSRMLAPFSTPTYRSTRDASAAVSFSDALLQGLAPDGGLYLPSPIPRLDETAWRDVRTFPDLAFTVLAPWLDEEVDSESQIALLADALSFPVPVVPLQGAG